MFDKLKPLRLTGKKLAALNKEIHDRDKDSCLLCKQWVDPGVKFHHVARGAFREDRKECGVTLCHRCHTTRAHGMATREVRIVLTGYLKALYPDYWTEHEFGVKAVAEK